MNAQDIQNALQDLDVALDVALPALGAGELTPIVDAATKIAQKLTAALEAVKSAQAPVLAAELAAGEAALDAAEEAKLAGKP